MSLFSTLSFCCCCCCCFLRLNCSFLFLFFVACTLHRCIKCRREYLISTASSDRCNYNVAVTLYIRGLCCHLPSYSTMNIIRLSLKKIIKRIKRNLGTYLQDHSTSFKLNQRCWNTVILSQLDTFSVPSGQFVLPVAFLTVFPLCRLLHVHFLDIFSPQESQTI